MPELDEKKRIIDYNTVNDPDENYYALIDNGTSGTGKVSIKGLGPANMISDAYSDQDTYAVGDVCIHNNILYVCNTEIDTPHAFDLSEWDPDTLGNYCSKLNGDVTEIKSSLADLTTFSEIGVLSSSHTTLSMNKNTYKALFLYETSGSNTLYTNFVPVASQYALVNNGQTFKIKDSAGETFNFTVAVSGDTVTFTYSSSSNPNAVMRFLGYK